MLSLPLPFFPSLSFSLSPLPLFSHGVVREKNRSRRRARGQHVRNSSAVDKAKTIMYVHILNLIFLYICSEQSNYKLLFCFSIGYFFFHCCCLCFSLNNSGLSQLSFIQKKKSCMEGSPKSSAGAKSRV